MIQRIVVAAALAAAPLLTSAAQELATAPPDTTGQVRTAPAQQPAPLPWYRPRHAVVQTGGGIGMVAAGVGYGLWRDRAELDVLVGYVPKKHAGSTLSIATAKLMFSPYLIPIKERWQLRPLTVGVYYSYTHGTINDEEPGQYTKGYYWFSTDTRIGPLLGSRITYARNPSPRGRARNISFYYELGTNDLYILSYAQNRRGLSPVDILTLSLGLKADF